MNLPTTLLDISIFGGLYFQIFLLVTFFEDEDEKNSSSSSLTLSSKQIIFPSVSITVPCFNEAKTLEKTIESLRGLNYPKDKLSILIVDDGSSDNTFDVAKKIVAQFSPIYNIRVVHQKNAGKYTALNRGITESTADFVGCLDADSFVHPEALARMVRLFTDPEVMAVTPALVVHQPSNILQYSQRVEYNIGVFIKKAMGKMDAIHVTPGPFSIFRRSVFAQVGLLRHAHNTEDMEIAFRLQSYHYKIKNCPTALVYTITPKTIPKLYRQRTRWSYGFIKNAIDYRKVFFNKKYGNFSMLTLPFAVLGIVFTFYMVGNFIYNFSISIADNFEKISVVGIHMPHFGFNWFFVNTEMNTILLIILISITLSGILIGRKIAEGKARPSIDILYFVAIYSFIAPLWLGKAVYNTILSRKTPWR